MIVPIIKKGEGRVVRDYRRVTLMLTLYKVYTMLAERLGEKVRKKEIIPWTQTGREWGRSTTSTF